MPASQRVTDMGVGDGWPFDGAPSRRHKTKEHQQGDIGVFHFIFSLSARPIVRDLQES